MFVLRFLLGGVVVASVPLVASRLSPGVAGVVVLVPVITLTSLLVTWSSLGTSSAQRVALGALIALPSLAVFLAVVVIAPRLHVPFVTSLIVALFAWAAVAALSAGLISRLH